MRVSEGVRLGEVFNPVQFSYLKILFNLYFIIPILGAMMHIMGLSFILRNDARRGTATCGSLRFQMRHMTFRVQIRVADSCGGLSIQSLSSLAAVVPAHALLPLLE